MISKDIFNFNPDKIILILGQSFKLEHFSSLKSKLKHTEFIYYNWDSTKNFSNIVNLVPAFDKVFSFDKDDCKNYNYKFLPLFYTDDSELSLVIQLNMIFYL